MMRESLREALTRMEASLQQTGPFFLGAREAMLTSQVQRTGFCEGNIAHRLGNQRLRLNNPGE